ncbi:pentapeptide repeat-containing protein [Cyanobium gracile UHCC 0139]|uniref:Pentapeptide repeat-containing protein n=1 Tax=Cyanobium gracile UHCC 0139 TaxID=3110308 RepID=A0ABU5RTT1_9CYAN|nr:pentapeptide repeat-containing protein [Cyanobium gracile]MEA5391148.1 pentapeptide repeat-containing protein [Cyanobium gracile UHCC 0139]
MLAKAQQSKATAWTCFGCLFALLIAVMILSPWGGSPGGLGIRGSETTIVERDKNWRVTKYSIQAGVSRTAWDWAGLIGVPVTLAFLGIWFQSQEQARAAHEAKQQRRLVAEENKEETLQRYLDRISQLLMDRDLTERASALEDPSMDDPVVQSASDLIRARTLSVLRSFSSDGERKSSVIYFLAESQILKKLRLSLADADLSNAHLNWADLGDVNLNGADLSDADLSGANLSRASLGGAKIRRAKLIGTHFRRTNLSEADLTEANLQSANLSGAELMMANLNNADLSEANLFGADLTGANLDGASLKGAHFSNTILPDGKKTGPAHSVFNDQILGMITRSQ